MRVAMFVFNSGNGDLRVHRQAELLARHGHEVRIYCFLEPGLPERETRSGYKICREDQRPKLTRFFDDRVIGAIRKPKPKVLATEVPEVALPLDREPTRPCLPPTGRRLDLASSPAVREHRDYVEQINRIWARKASRWKPHVCQAHDADALRAAGLTAEACGAALVYDAHELWSEQPFIRDQESVDYWNHLEVEWIGKAARVFTVNRPLAAILEQRYGISGVIALHNCQVLQDRPNPKRLSERVGGRKVALYQGVYAPDRGLEELVAASVRMPNVVVALRGFGEREAYLREMARKFSLPVLFLEPADSKNIVAAAAEADIGLMPFLPTCLNHYLSTPNKLFEYMMAGLPMAGSDIPEMRVFVQDLGLGRLFDPYSGSDIASALEELATQDLPAMGARARQLAETTYNWEQEGQKLLDAYQELAGLVGN